MDTFLTVISKIIGAVLLIALPAIGSAQTTIWYFLDMQDRCVLAADEAKVSHLPMSSPGALADALRAEGNLVETNVIRNKDGTIFAVVLSYGREKRAGAFFTSLQACTVGKKLVEHSEGSPSELH